jgi:hypothetical protein
MTELSATDSAPPGPSPDLPANGPAVSEAEFMDLFTQLRGWSDGELPDERGTLAAVGPDTIQAALAVPRLGRTVSLALPINRVSGPDNARPALHHMVDLGDVEEPEPSAHKDFIGLDYHGKAFTHPARGSIVDTEALTAAMAAGRLAGAGLDVFAPEPLPAGHPLFALDNVVLSPPALAWTDEMALGNGRSAIRAILDVRDGRQPEYLANPAVLDHDRFRHLARAVAG